MWPTRSTKKSTLTFLATLILSPQLLPGVSAACNVQSCTIAGGATLVAEPVLYYFYNQVGVWCAAAVGAGVITIGAIVPDILCVGTIAIPAAIGGGAGGCFSCSAAKQCDPGDTVARAHACGLSGGTGAPDQAVLGPAKCLQLGSSVPSPDPNTDRPGFKSPSGIDYTFHCANSGLVLGQDQSTCYWPCAQCDQCAGVVLPKPGGARRDLGNTTLIDEESHAGN